MALRLFCGVTYAGGEFVLFHFLNRVITHDPSAIVRATTSLRGFTGAWGDNPREGGAE